MRINYISAIVALALVLGSCQKDEFNEAYSEASNAKVQTVTAESTEGDDTISGSGSSIVSDGTQYEGEHDEVLIRVDDVEINIKEVSDGDEEADKGDDSKTD